ncbi:MAG: hypothetical protein H8E17_14880 [Deltaproteobacteria bacterium]|nr:hypothetical protein [Deltaproteobacteria bacterium]
MRRIDKTIFKWTEPRQLTSFWDIIEKKKVRIGIFLFWMAAYISFPFLIWYIAKIQFDRQVPISKFLFHLVIWIIFPFVYIIVFRAIEKCIGITFTVSEEGINCYSMLNSRNWKFKQYVGFFLKPYELQESGSFLNFLTPKGEHHLIGGISQQDGKELTKVLRETIGLEYREQQS